MNNVICTGAQTQSVSVGDVWRMNPPKEADVSGEACIFSVISLDDEKKECVLHLIAGDREPEEGQSAVRYTVEQDLIIGAHNWDLLSSLTRS